MNREIEFRGKCVPDSKYAGEWVTGGYVAPEADCKKQDEGLIISYFGGNSTFTYHVIPETVGQFTGMKDKNGVKIFEGDIVRVCDDDSIDIGVVRYNEDFGKYIVVYSQVSGNWFDFEGSYGEFLGCFYSEVIGNVYDNPELLEKKE